MKKKHVKAEQAYKNQCQKALDLLISKIEPDLRSFCEKWGFDFTAGMGVWSFTYGGKYAEPRYRKRGFELHLLGDPKWFLDFLDQDLADALEITIGRQSLGSLIDDITIDATGQEWVAIKADEWCLDEPKEFIEIVGFDQLSGLALLDEEFAYFGLVPIQLAEIVLAEYKHDWDSGSRLLGSLPALHLEDLTNA